MGHTDKPTIIYVGLARLPQPLVAPAPTVAVELEVELQDRRIIAANTNLQFPGLERLLREVLVGQVIDSFAGRAMLEFEVRYCATFATAVRAAVQSAVRRAVEDAASEDGARPRPVEAPTVPAWSSITCRGRGRSRPLPSLPDLP